MKRIVLLVLTFVAIVIADEEEQIQQIATLYEIDVETTKGCLNEAGTTLREMQFDEETWKKIISNKKDEKTEEYIKNNGCFIACILEKKDMMKDSKLVLDKLLEGFEKQSSLGKMPSKEVITECVNTSNKNIELTRETRAFGFIICLSRTQETASKI
ncbi:uncharacterized protein [Anoplolepis gracilipes]|uniref:uncharacterized protein n=1 Tax=Anoplolepis gracilipes TaxID=354296 RepID=UPI003BA0653A